ncbi:hypothetical protein [Streptomyces erythrochromogenes]|uniref:hypothetical protein n=1 Tax=Streptomyces erythrochromogenes TaxID=285574 RepID=UPI00225666FD|nr:hypothetical protein [Streptomyces erythrochromogenes]MCX5587582.1 hypothetical protein [Streptomyces erythrochromogenes]
MTDEPAETAKIMGQLRDCLAAGDEMRRRKIKLRDENEQPTMPRPERRPVDTSGCATRRTSITHLLDRAGRGVLSVNEAELLRVQVEAELRVADMRAEQAETERDKACTAFNAKVIQLEQAKRNQLGDFETISYWTSQTTLAREHSDRADRARASTILQAQRWAARARAAEAVLEHLEARIDAVLEPQEPTP